MELSKDPPAGQTKWRLLWRTARTSPHRAARLFALAELVCFPVSLAALVALGVTAAAGAAGLRPPDWWARYTLPVLVTAAVGYLTNYLAVRMLFEPYSPRGWHWLRLVTFGLWRQGLVPARKQDLGEGVGREVSRRLLTPEMITEELTGIAERALDDEHFRARLRAALPGAVRRHLPEVIDRLTPEVMELLRDSVSTGLTQENLLRFTERVIDPWLSVPETRERVVTGLVGLLQQQTPRLIDFMKGAADRYGRRGLFKSLLLDIAEGSGALDWDEVSDAINEQLRSTENRHHLAGLLGDLTGALKRQMDRPETRPAIDRLRDEAAHFVGHVVHDVLAAELPEKVAHLLDGDAFWDWLGEEALPAMKPAVTKWLRTEGYEIIGKRFDVAGRIKAAVDKMDVAAVHEMVDAVATEQLGAIQVLGFVLGFFAGIPLLFLL